MAPNLEKVQSIKLYIQDKEYIVNADDITPDTSLNSYIRSNLQLTGTKGLCYEGGCGACVVAIYRKDPDTNEDVYLAINSCLVPVLSCNGWKIYTVESIGNENEGYHPVQKAIIDFNGTQCGFCTPGFLMNMYALYESGTLTMAEVENSFGGNICRCTGYRPILSAFKSLCTDASSELLGQYPDIEDLKICKKDKCEKKCVGKCDRQSKTPFYHQLADSQWIKVFALSDVLSILRENSNATYMLVAGNTAQGVYRSYGGSYDIYIDVSSVAELKVNKFVDSNFVLGADTSLTTALKTFKQIGGENPQFSYFSQLATHIDLIANVPVRNVGTLAGNLIMKHDNHDYPSDIFTILEAVGAIFTVVATDGTEVQLSPHDFINYDVKLKVLRDITFPPYSPDTVKFTSYKIMPRAQNSHAHVNAAFLFKFNANGNLDAASIVYGNINPTFIHATQTENLLAGKNLFDNAILQQAVAALSNELICDIIPPDPTPEFRKQLAISLFYKAVLSFAPAPLVSPVYQSGGTVLERPVSSGAQDYVTNESLYPLTQPISKIESLAQSTGQAQYITDMPDLPHQLYGTLILANAPPSSVIRSIDASKALAIDGIVAFYTKDDIPGTNSFITQGAQEEIFCSGFVNFYQQPVGILVGTSSGILRSASSQIQITYDPPTAAPLLSTRQILAAGRTDRITPTGTYTPTRKGNDVEFVVKGSFDIYHQYHFHLENQCCTVIPNENGLDIYPGTQWMDMVQSGVANMLKIPNNKLNISVRRLGGAFGAKITRNGLISCAASLAAWKLKQPVKVNMSLPDNMAAIGKRYPLSHDYEVGLDSNGVIQYLNCTLYTDVGGGTSKSGNAAYEILNLFRATYVNDTFQLQMDVATTDTHNNTSTRAPGSTEGFAAIEAIMEHCAAATGIDGAALRAANLPTNSPLFAYLDDLKSWADIDQRKQDIEAFNQANRWKKRGMAIVPMVYPFGISGPFAAMVSIFHGDGSVQISHGGIEVGQGINTKAAQVCAYKLGIPVERVAVIPSNNFVSANGNTTGGSVTSEAVCYSVVQACDTLNIRLQPYKDRQPNGTWQNWITAAFRDYVVLSAAGQFSPNAPNAASYPIYGTCATEVLVDILTGQHLITRVDLIEDTGQSMSPLIDIGQVEGAFIMGTGYYTSEKIVFDYEGKILTNNTWTYYPPGPKDIPIDFRIKFPNNNPNPVGVLQSKAIAEPPLLLSITVPLAIRKAVASARLDAASTNPTWFPIDGPTTVENVYLNSLNDITQYIL